MLIGIRCWPCPSLAASQRRGSIYRVPFKLLLNPDISDISRRALIGHAAERRRRSRCLSICFFKRMLCSRRSVLEEPWSVESAAQFESVSIKSVDTAFPRQCLAGSSPRGKGNRRGIVNDADTRRSMCGPIIGCNYNNLGGSALFEKTTDPSGTNIAHSTCWRGSVQA